MWAEKGGLDFEGRARWDAWTAVKVRCMGGCVLLAVVAVLEK
jgi:acyl-CoA-binding protein